MDRAAASLVPAVDAGAGAAARSVRGRRLLLRTAATRCGTARRHIATESARPQRAAAAAAAPAPVPAPAARAPAARAPAAPAAAAASPPAATAAITASPSRVLFIGGLPGEADACGLEAELAAAAAPWQPTRVAVMRFEDAAQRTRFSQGWKHKGYALLAFTDEASLEPAAAAVRRIPRWGAAATLGPARKVPADGWPPELTYTAAELAALRAAAAAQDARRAHNRRQRQRQTQRWVDGVGQLLAELPQPFGSAALQQYQPLLGSRCQQQLWAAAGSAGSPAAAAQALAAALPEPLRSCLRPGPLQQALAEQQQLLQVQCSPQPGPIQVLPAAMAPAPAAVEGRLLLDWACVPQACDPAFGGQLAAADVVRNGHGAMNLRALRKRVQVESFALLLWQLSQQQQQQRQQQQPLRHAPLRVVELGSGSGSLVLALAHLFPAFVFHAVDKKQASISLLRQRAANARLTNVSAQIGLIEEWAGAADVVLALHACGSATDLALAQAVRCGAAVIASPCCIGKLNRAGGAAGRGVTYPRSRLLRGHLDALAARLEQQQQQQQQQQQPPNDLEALVMRRAGGRREQRAGLFSMLATAADYSHAAEHSHPQLAALAKTNVELDRGRSIAEAAGFRVALLRLLLPALSAKCDVIVGAPPADDAARPPRFSWAWE